MFKAFNKSRIQLIHINQHSPVNEPLVLHEPFLRLVREDMHVLVEVPHDEDLIVIADGLAPKKLLRLLECRFMLFDLVGLCVEDEAVRNPAVVTSEDHNL